MPLAHEKRESLGQAGLETEASRSDLDSRA